MTCFHPKRYYDTTELTQKHLYAVGTKNGYQFLIYDSVPFLLHKRSTLHSYYCFAKKFNAFREKMFVRKINEPRYRVSPISHADVEDGKLWKNGDKRKTGVPD